MADVNALTIILPLTRIVNPVVLDGDKAGIQVYSDPLLADMMNPVVLHGDIVGIIDKKALVKIRNCEPFKCDVARIRDHHSPAARAGANNRHRLPRIRADNGWRNGCPGRAVDVDVLIVEPGSDVQSVPAPESAYAIVNFAPWARCRATCGAVAASWRARVVYE